jgi:hypothetical protein
MSWLSRVRSGIPFLPKRQTADTLWHKCAKCGTMVFVKEWEENYSVCPRCDFHDRIGPAKRFEQLFDAAEYELLPAPEVREDPLRFKAKERYTEKLKEARAKTGERDALINARGKIDGRTAIVGVQDFAFMGGSMGIALGAAFLVGARAAIAERAPYIIFTASGGARMQEAILSLMQLPRLGGLMACSWSLGQVSRLTLRRHTLVTFWTRLGQGSWASWCGDCAKQRAVRGLTAVTTTGATTLDTTGRTPMLMRARPRTQAPRTRWVFVPQGTGGGREGGHLPGHGISGSSCRR